MYFDTLPRRNIQPHLPPFDNQRCLFDSSLFLCFKAWIFTEASLKFLLVIIHRQHLRSRSKSSQLGLRLKQEILQIKMCPFSNKLREQLYDFSNAASQHSQDAVSQFAAIYTTPLTHSHVTAELWHEGCVWHQRAPKVENHCCCVWGVSPRRACGCSTRSNTIAWKESSHGFLFHHGHVTLSWLTECVKEQEPRCVHTERPRLTELKWLEEVRSKYRNGLSSTWIGALRLNSVNVRNNRVCKHHNSVESQNSEAFGDVWNWNKRHMEK